MSAASAPPAGPPKLVNLYNVRTVATAKPCFICSKETKTCLANADVSDFLYSCISHLNDRGFASPAPSSTPSSPAPASPSVSQSEIDKVTAEYKAKQAAKSASPAPADPSSASKGWISSAFSAATSASSAALSAAGNVNDKLFPPPPPPAVAAPVVVPKQVVLQRSVFAMRVDEKRRAWQKAEARRRVEGFGGLPSVPGGLPAKR